MPTKLSLKDWKSYKEQLEKSWKVHQMALITDTILLKEAECQIETMLKEEEKNTESAKN